MDDYIVVQCCHCGGDVLIMRNEINCTIFRHGVMKDTFQQINPHSPKDECDMLRNNDMIYGCGKPFRVVDDRAVLCDYI